MMKYVVLYNTHVRRIIAVLAILCAVCVFLYGFLLLGAVAHAAKQTAAAEQVVALTAKVGNLQGQYLKKTTELTPDLAQQMGFVAPEKVSTVYANPAVVLSLNGR